MVAVGGVHDMICGLLAWTHSRRRNAAYIYIIDICSVDLLLKLVARWASSVGSRTRRRDTVIAATDNKTLIYFQACTLRDKAKR